MAARIGELSRKTLERPDPEGSAEIIDFPAAGRHYPKSVRVDNVAKRALKRTDDEIVRLVLAHFAAQMSAALVNNGLEPLTVHDEVERSVEMAVMVQTYRLTLGDLDFAIGIYLNQIEIVAEVLAALLNGDRNIALLAETQFGKTGILCTSILLFNLYQRDREKKVFIRLISPNLIGVEKQTKGDMDRFSALLSAIKLGDTTVRDANAIYFNQTDRLSRKANTSSNNETEKQLMERLANGYDSTLNQCGYTEQLVLVDEADEALGSTSYMMKLMNAAHRTGVKTRFLFCSATAWEYKCLESFQVIEAPITMAYAGFVRGRQIPVVSFETMARLVGKSGEGLSDFSITRDYEKIEIVTALVDLISSGVPLNAKTIVKKFDPFAPSKNEQWIEHEVMARDIGFNGKPWQGGEGMLIRYGKNGAQLEYLMKRRCRSMARKGITMLAYQGSGKGTEITIYAPGHPEADCDFITETIPANLCHTAENLLKEAREIFDRYSMAHGFMKFQFVIGVVGLARRAMRFPKECAFFVDMSEAPTTMTALEQGTLGRATGWNKITENIMPIVCMSNKVVKVVAKVRALFAIYGKKIPVIRPSQYSVKSYREPTFRMAVIVTLDSKNPMWGRYSPKLQQALRRINDLIMSQTKFVDSTSGKIRDGKRAQSPVKKYSKSGGDTVSSEGKIADGWDFRGDNFVRQEFGDGKGKAWTFYDIFGILGEDGITEIEEIFTEDFGGQRPENDVVLLRPGQVRGDGRRYAATPTGEVHISYRSAEADEELGAGKFGVIGQREGRNTHKNNGWVENIVDPSVFVSSKSGSVKMLGLTLMRDAMNSRGVDQETIDHTYCKANTAPGKHMTTKVELEAIRVLAKDEMVAE